MTSTDVTVVFEKCITLTSPCNLDRRAPQFYIVKLGFSGVNIIQLSPLCEGNMTVCSPEAGNIARGQYYLSKVNKSSCYPHTRATIVLLDRRQKQQQPKIVFAICRKIEHWSTLTSFHLQLNCIHISFSKKRTLNAAGSLQMYKMTVWSLQLACTSSQSDQSLWLPKDPNKILVVRKGKCLISLHFITD